MPKKYTTITSTQNKHNVNLLLNPCDIDHTVQHNEIIKYHKKRRPKLVTEGRNYIFNKPRYFIDKIDVSNMNYLKNRFSFFIANSSNEAEKITNYLRNQFKENPLPSNVFNYKIEDSTIYVIFNEESFKKKFEHSKPEHIILNLSEEPTIFEVFHSHCNKSLGNKLVKLDIAIKCKPSNNWLERIENQKSVYYNKFI
ncbi:MAG: hypothetical protein ACK4OM_07485 [Alphaproteobacteria bacterium]